jgi:hypothetical protein
MTAGPGERGEEVEGDSPGAKAAPYDKCANGPATTLKIVSRRSPEFESASANLASHVEIWPTAALAVQAVAADRSPRGRACKARLFHRIQGRFRYSNVVVYPEPTPLRGVAGSFWERMQTVATELGKGGGNLHPVYFDSLGFLSGPAEIVLTITASPRPMPAAAELRLLSLLYTRSRARQLLRPTRG